MTAWAVTTFYNELDVLEIKLATLDHLIDRWVIAEASVDHRGKPKPMHLAAALGEPRFDPWREKIRHVAVLDMPDRQTDDTEADWEREHWQRNALLRAMDDLEPDDQVMIGDLDEIPYPRALNEALNSTLGMRFAMDMFVYRLNWRWTEHPVAHGSATVVQPGRAFQDDVPREKIVHHVLLQTPAAWRVGEHGNAIVSGWHLAYMGSPEMIAAKTTAIADDAWVQLIPEAKKEGRDRDSWFTPEWAAHCAATGEDIYGRDERQAEWVDLDQLPPYVAENLDRFAHLLAPEPGTATAYAWSQGWEHPFVPRLCARCRARIAWDTTSYCGVCIGELRAEEDLPPDAFPVAAERPDA